MMFGNKKGQMQLIVLLVIIGGAFWLLGGGGGLLSQTGGGSSTTTTASGATVINIPAEDATVTFLADDSFDSGISCLGNHQYRTRISSADQWGGFQAVADGSSVTTGSTDQIQVVWCEANSSTGSPRFFIGVTEQSLTGSGAVTLTNRDLVRNGSITIRVINEEGNVMDDSGENETLGAGDVVSLEWDIEVQFERAAPYGGVLVLEYNSSAYDVSGLSVTTDGLRQKTAVPTFYSERAVAGSSSIAFEIPPLVSNGKHRGSINIDVDDTNDPEAGAGVGNDILLTFFPTNYYLDNDDDTYKLGVEDEDGVAVSPAPTSLTLRID